jgi:hydroxyquinol 1,2-dioxygenase
MRNLTQDNITQAVIARFADTPDPRLKEIVTSLVQHLHAFARDVKLTEDEWFQGIQFLTRTGHITTTSARNSSCCRTCWACRCSRWP